MLDTSTPSLARAYDYLLGGAANFAADRSLAGRLLPVYPLLPGLLSASRRYAAESVARVARAGVDQYLDIGSGLPTRPSTHEAARAVRPSSRVVYIDRDAAVIDQAMTAVPAGVRYLRGDLAEPEALLAALAAPGLIDLSRPACLILALAVQALDAGTARAVVGVLVRALAPGSYLVLTAAAGERGRLPDSVAPGGCTEAEMASFLAGLELLPPGIHGGDVLCATGVKAAPAHG